MLIRIDQFHALNYPENDSVENLAKVTQAFHILGLIELLESTRLLTDHLSRDNVETCKSLVLNPSMDPINRRTPTHDGCRPEISISCTTQGLFEIFTFVDRGDPREEFVE